jgi:hypothetical protein
MIVPSTNATDRLISELSVAPALNAGRLGLMSIVFLLDKAAGAYCQP